MPNLQDYLRETEELLDKANIDHGFPPQPPWLHAFIKTRIERGVELALEETKVLKLSHSIYCADAGGCDCGVNDWNKAHEDQQEKQKGFLG